MHCTITYAYSNWVSWHMSFDTILFCNQTDSASDGRYPADSLGSNSVQSVTKRNMLPASRSPPSVSNRRTRPSIRSNKSSPPSRGGDVDQAKKYDYKVDVTGAADATPIKTVTGEKLLKEGNVRARLEARASSAPAC